MHLFRSDIGKLKLSILDTMQQQSTMKITRGSPYPYGASKKNGGINFSIYAKDVDKLFLCLFHEDQLENPYVEYELDPHFQKTGDVWHAYIEDIAPPLVYGYKVKRNNEEWMLLDPYAKAVAGPLKWREKREGNETYRPLGKVVNNQEFDWEGDKPLLIPKHNLVIYEMHVRGFTKHSSSGVSHPGTYRGIIEKIPYLKELGVNAIELMPIHEFNETESSSINPQTQQKLHNYFGYSTVNFFSPMTRFASEPEGEGAVIEFKTMVKELHKNGIEVILDVVFNHTSEGNEKGPTLSFKGFDAPCYYMINQDGQYLNFSGCGNTLNCNHPVTEQLIIESLRYWITEMHVDGFRFDLASILTRAQDGTPLGMPPVVVAITKDPLLTQAKLIAEAWDAGGLYQVGTFAPKDRRWSEWNGKFRDRVRKFIKGTEKQKKNFSSSLYGSKDIYVNCPTPYCSVNFITAHDGFTLNDLVSYNEKHNEVNGEGNRDGLNENDSWNCGFEGPTDNNEIQKLRLQQMRNFHLALLVSQGIPMVYMGDEYGHTRHGNNNGWCQDNEQNWFLWDQLEKNAPFYQFYKDLIHFKKSHSLMNHESFLPGESIKWHGVKPLSIDWDSDDRFLAFTLHFPSGEPGIYCAFNASPKDVEVTIPKPGQNQSWVWIVNTHSGSAKNFFHLEESVRVEKETITMPSHTALLLLSK